MQRTITLRAYYEEAFANFMEENREQCQEALGYLSTWSPTSYDKVDIYWTVGDRSDPTFDGAEFTATYKDSERLDRVYVIGAIWHCAERCFSFHS